MYTSAAHGLSVAKAYSQVKVLAACIKDSGLCDTALLDNVLLSAIKAAGTDASQSKEIDSLMKLLRTDSSKVSAAAVRFTLNIYIQQACGGLLKHSY